jgi:hypothetical protein
MKYHYDDRQPLRNWSIESSMAGSTASKHAAWSVDYALPFDCSILYDNLHTWCIARSFDMRSCSDSMPRSLEVFQNGCACNDAACLRCLKVSQMPKPAISIHRVLQISNVHGLHMHCPPTSI